MKIALSHFRVGETDGVSLEMDKWAIALESLGHTVVYIAGSKGETKRDTLIIEEMHYKSQVNANIKRAFYEDLGNYTEKTLQDAIYGVADSVTKKLVNIIRDEKIDILVPNNIFSLGHDIPTAIGFYNAILETNVKVICHHHDFWWESSRPFYQTYTTDWAKMVMNQYFPPTDARMDIKHCVINSLAQKDLKEKKNLDSLVVPNVFDFVQPLFTADDYNADFKKALGLSENQILLLQATRVTNRKAIELAVDVVNHLNRAEVKNRFVGKTDYMGRKINNDVEFVLGIVGLHEGVDHYEDRLFEYIDQTKAKVIVNPHLVEHSRTNINGKKIYSLWDAYVYADVVTYPSIQEGWGNQFLEAVFAKKPIVVFEYAVYKADIKPKGFLVASLGDTYEIKPDKLTCVSEEIIDAVSKDIEKYMTDDQYRQHVVEKNFQLCKEFFSMDALTNILKTYF